MTTGSSIMPNKRNPDVVELLRASCSITQGALAELQSLVALPSGYHRDLQLTKGPVMRSLEEVRASLAMLPALLGGLSFDERRLAEATTRDTLATDRAVELATSGMPFRDAYRIVAAEVGGRDEPAGEPARTSLERRVSLGASGQLALERISARLDELFDEVSAAEGA
jgi:argininosuccinate lyase